MRLGHPSIKDADEFARRQKAKRRKPGMFSCSMKVLERVAPEGGLSIAEIVRERLSCAHPFQNELFGSAGGPMLINWLGLRESGLFPKTVASATDGERGHTPGLMVPYEGLTGKRGLGGFLATLAGFLALCMVISPGTAHAACTVPNQILNGQIADAVAVMNDFTAIKDCINTVATTPVSTSGIPTAGSMPVFSGPNSVTSGNLSGDCNTLNSLAVTCSKTNGTPFGFFATGTDAARLTANVSVNQFANGASAGSSTFLRGDGTWAVPPGTGGAPRNPTPTIRSTNITSFNSNSVTISWPAGTVSGDLVIVFVSAAYGINPPSNWSILDNNAWDQTANGLTIAKVMTAVDITAGSITLTIANSFYGVAAAVTIDGATFHALRQTSAHLHRDNSISAVVSGLLTAEDTDLIVGFNYVNNTVDISMSNFTQLQRVNAPAASAFLGKFASVLGKVGLAETATYNGGVGEYYWSAVAIQ